MEERGGRTGVHPHPGRAFPHDAPHDHQLFYQGKRCRNRSKAAVVGLTRYVATMFGADGIRCVAVAPGLVMTDALRRFPEKALAEYAAERVLPWPAEVEDIAATVAFLASDEARAITGQTIVVDSGTTIHRPRHAMGQWQEMLKAHPEWLDG